MSNTARLQVNVPVEVKEEFERIAEGFGMDLSSAIRFMMTQWNSGAIVPAIKQPKMDHLSPQAAARYEKMIEDIESGKEKTYGPYDSSRSLMEQLDAVDLDEEN